MQTILGANGVIGEGIARALKKRYTNDIRLVSRSPKKINDSDQLHPADLLNKEEASRAIAGSEIVFFAVGLPMDTKVWQEQFPIILSNVINGCKKHNCKLVYFDNTYMYPMTGELLTEETDFRPNGPKAKLRAEMAESVLHGIKAGDLEAMICRAPEFYGPGKTQSITNSFIFDNIRKKKTLKVPVSDTTLRTLIYTPDASLATALLGNTPDCYGQTWHLPCDDDRVTYKKLVELCNQLFHKYFPYSVVSEKKLKLAALVNKNVREILELLPRYGVDNLFDSGKFKKRFPGFATTDIRDGITEIRREMPGETDNDQLLSQLMNV